MPVARPFRPARRGTVLPLLAFCLVCATVLILRRTEPDRPRPFRIWLYPLPCGLALVGWLVFGPGR